ncbi:MAG: hypothetical protein GWN71_18470, partial [Gammaproteobacteria bacterium]|nr:hypothetical protein [Gemmatimonadota bacterium]NIU75483.1 hypothetical protein [Gammaproteobacteria bacterium]NIX21427.1 hypothetical protein [Actinomycetota bacterium]
RSAPLTALVLVLSAPGIVRAQSPGGGDGGLDDRVKQAQAVRLDGALDLDGVPDEDAWTRAEWFD